VLPLRAEHLCVSLAPDTVACAIWPGSRCDGHPTSRAVLPCVRDAQVPPWRPALDVLQGWLPSLVGRRGSVRVVLSNHFVRYLVVPWQASLTSAAEREAFARHLFHERHGEAANRWEVRLSDAGYGDAALACAVDAELMRLLPEVFAGTRWRLRFVEPLLMVAFNRYRGEIGKQAALFVREPDRLCCGVVTDGEWRTVHALRAERDVPNDALVSRAMQVLGLPEDVPLFRFPDTPAVRSGEEAR
jgi:hypothetical protein